MSDSVTATSQTADGSSPHHLASARHEGGGRISLRFADGFTATVDLSELGIDVSALKMESARESWCSAVEIDKAGGGTYHVDSAVLRAHCDPQHDWEWADAGRILQNGK